MIALRDTIRKLSRQVFPKKRVLRIFKLRKEASNRDYYRIHLSSRRTCIAMVILDPANDPGMVQRIFDAAESFNAYRIRTPSIYRFFPEENILFLKDAGPLSLEAFYHKSGKNKYLPIYKSIIDALVKIHTQPVPAHCKVRIPFRTRFTPERFMNEFAFFLEHSGLNERLAPASRTILIETFKSACGGMCRERFVLNHRDLHSRNIQVDNGSFILLDFQDARLGPPSYDLVSLVKDSYVNLSNRVETELISYYLDNSAKHTRGKIDSAAFFQGYYRCLFQRSLKAAGTFYHQSRNLGRAKYRKYIPRVLHYAISAVPKLDLAPRRKRVLETELSRLKEEIRP